MLSLFERKYLVELGAFREVILSQLARPQGRGGGVGRLKVTDEPEPEGPYFIVCSPGLRVVPNRDASSQMVLHYKRPLGRPLYFADSPAMLGLLRIVAFR